MSKDPDKTELKEFSNIPTKKAVKFNISQLLLFKIRTTNNIYPLEKPTQVQFPAYAVKSDDSNQTIRRPYEKQKFNIRPPGTK
jgi:hypothetical protein